MIYNKALGYRGHGQQQQQKAGEDNHAILTHGLHNNYHLWTLHHDRVGGVLFGKRVNIYRTNVRYERAPMSVADYIPPEAVGADGVAVVALTAAEMERSKKVLYERVCESTCKR